LRSEFAACGSALPPAALEAALAALEPDVLAYHLTDWLVFARDDQLPPAAAPGGGPWRTWLLLGGRGAGKTRAGAEWVRAQALGIPPLADRPFGRIALVSETLDDAREVMVEGVSGLLAIHRNGERPRFEPSRAQLTWPNGAIAQLYSAQDPDSLRGPQFDAAWTDEIAKWPQPEAAWDMLQLALRLGPSPRAVATTTPRPIGLLRRLVEDPMTAVSRARTTDNAPNLAASFLAEMARRYSGTAIGRQELEGEIIDESAGALFRADWIEANRHPVPPELERIVVAVDPPVTATQRSDACGIVVAGLGHDRRAYVLADRSLQGRQPMIWARAVVAAYRDFEADRVVAEVNQGGDLVVELLRQIDPAVPVGAVRATRGKWVRAEPVAALYAEGRVCHVGRHVELEREMVELTAAGLAAGRSPDRLDALVWALTELLVAPTARPSLRRL
jgi:phage terminase large subunit-like protein